MNSPFGYINSQRAVLATLFAAGVSSGCGSVSTAPSAVTQRVAVAGQAEVTARPAPTNGGGAPEVTPTRTPLGPPRSPPQPYTLEQAHDGRRSAANPTEPQTLSAESSSVDEAPAWRASGAVMETEVVGLRVTGRRAWQKLTIDDFDVLLRPDGVRMLPLLRTLRVLAVDTRRDGSRVLFHLGVSRDVVLDTTARTATINQRRINLDLTLGISDITGQPDIYVRADQLHELLPIDFVWDDANYQFNGATRYAFEVWDRDGAGGRRSLFADAEFVEVNLPENPDAAYPGRGGLSMLEARLATQFSTGSIAAGERLFVQSDPTVWGNIAGGTYRVNFANLQHEFNAAGDNQRGWSERFVPQRAELRFTQAQSEFVVGDSSFGVHDFAFPIAGITGLRINGLAGVSADAMKGDASSLGLHRRFYRPYTFEGYAPVGSDVRLELNGTVIDEQEILDEVDPISGLGLYRFEDVSISNRSLSNIVVVIKEPNGVETEIKKDVVAAPMQLAPGSFAYLAGLGTNRSTRAWETIGTLAAGRLLYGLSEHYTLGASIVTQDEIFGFSRGTGIAGERPFPQQSQHAAMEITGQLLPNLVLSGDVGISQGEDPSLGSEYDGKAMRLSADYFPFASSRFRAQAFHFSPGFFDGRNLSLEDKRGVYVNGLWQPTNSYAVRAGAGSVEELDVRVGQLRRDVTFAQLELSARLFGRARWQVGVVRYTPSWEEPRLLTTIRGQSQLPGAMRLRLDVALGDNLDFGRNRDFLQGLSLPGLRRFGSPNRAALLEKRLTDRTSVGVEYRDTNDTEEALLVHAYERSKLRLSSKLGFDFDRKEPVWEGWWDYRLHGDNRNRISLVTRRERGEWRLDLGVSLAALFDTSRGGLSRVKGARFNPDRGGVRGKVFVDLNGNGLLDDGEPGVPEVKISGRSAFSVATDADGEFTLPTIASDDTVHVALDIDTVPATFAVIHGQQKAFVGAGGITNVDLALAPIVALSGSILVQPVDAATLAALAAEAQAVRETGVSAPGWMQDSHAGPDAHGDPVVTPDTAMLDPTVVQNATDALVPEDAPAPALAATSPQWMLDTPSDVLAHFDAPVEAPVVPASVAAIVPLVITTLPTPPVADVIPEPPTATPDALSADALPAPPPVALADAATPAVTTAPIPAPSAPQWMLDPQTDVLAQFDAPDDAPAEAPVAAAAAATVAETPVAASAAAIVPLLITPLPAPTAADVAPDPPTATPDALSADALPAPPPVALADAATPAVTTAPIPAPSAPQWMLDPQTDVLAQFDAPDDAPAEAPVAAAAAATVAETPVAASAAAIVPLLITPLPAPTAADVAPDPPTATPDALSADALPAPPPVALADATSPAVTTALIPAPSAPQWMLDPQTDVLAQFDAPADALPAPPPVALADAATPAVTTAPIPAPSAPQWMLDPQTDVLAQFDAPAEAPVAAAVIPDPPTVTPDALSADALPAPPPVALADAATPAVTTALIPAPSAPQWMLDPQTDVLAQFDAPAEAPVAAAVIPEPPTVTPDALTADAPVAAATVAETPVAASAAAIVPLVITTLPTPAVADVIPEPPTATPDALSADALHAPPPVALADAATPAVTTAPIPAPSAPQWMLDPQTDVLAQFDAPAEAPVAAALAIASANVSRSRPTNAPTVTLESLEPTSATLASANVKSTPAPALSPADTRNGVVASGHVPVDPGHRVIDDSDRDTQEPDRLALASANAAVAPTATTAAPSATAQPGPPLQLMLDALSDVEAFEPTNTAIASGNIPPDAVQPPGGVVAATPDEPPRHVAPPVADAVTAQLLAATGEKLMVSTGPHGAATPQQQSPAASTARRRAGGMSISTGLRSASAAAMPSDQADASRLDSRVEPIALTRAERLASVPVTDVEAPGTLAEVAAPVLRSASGMGISTDLHSASRAAAAADPTDATGYPASVVPVPLLRAERLASVPNTQTGLPVTPDATAAPIQRSASGMGISTTLQSASRAAALRNQAIIQSGGDSVVPIPLARAQRLASIPATNSDTDNTPTDAVPPVQPSASGMKLASRIASSRPTAIAGVRVYIRDQNQNIVVDSITAADGSFYFGDLRPGRYTLDVDQNTIPAGYVMLQMSKEITIESADDFREITLPPIYVAEVNR